MAWGVRRWQYWVRLQGVGRDGGLVTITGLPTPAPIDSILSSLRASSSAFCCSRKPVRYDDLSVYDDTDAAGG